MVCTTNSDNQWKQHTEKDVTADESSPGHKGILFVRATPQITGHITIHICREAMEQISHLWS